MRIQSEGTVPEKRKLRLAGQCQTCLTIVVDVYADDEDRDSIAWIEKRSNIAMTPCPKDGCGGTIYLREQTRRNKTIPDDAGIELDEPEDEAPFNKAERLKSELDAEREVTKSARQELNAIRRILDIDDNADVVAEVRRVKRGN